MTPQEMIEEAHGLWELAAMRYMAMCEAKAEQLLIIRAQIEEREAFYNWLDVSIRVIDQALPKACAEGLTKQSTKESAKA